MDFQVKLANALKALLPPDHFGPAPLIDFKAALKTVVESDGIAPTCEHFHDHSCMVQQIIKAINIFKRAHQIYFLVHLVPFLLYKRKDFRQKPFKTIFKLLSGWLKSMAFICWLALSRTGWCALTNAGFINRKKFIIIFAVASLGIFFEPAGRAAEITMYVLPRYLESLPTFLGKMRLFPNMYLGINLLTAFSIGVTSSCYFTDRSCVKQQIQWFLSLILGKPDEIKPVKDEESSFKTISAKP